MPSHFTLNAEGFSELIEKKSRFLAFAKPWVDVEGLSADDLSATFVQTLRKKYHDAQHVCMASRLGTGPQQIERYTDDGEPRHAGGFPILQLLQNQGIEDAIVVVVRYFGGVKLGSGGLARAYRACAKASIESAGLKEVIPKFRIHYTISYDLLAKLEHFIISLQGIEILDKIFTQNIKIVFEIHEDLKAFVIEKLADFFQISKKDLLNRVTRELL